LDHKFYHSSFNERLQPHARDNSSHFEPEGFRPTIADSSQARGALLADPLFSRFIFVHCRALCNCRRLPPPDHCPARLQQDCTGLLYPLMDVGGKGMDAFWRSLLLDVSNHTAENSGRVKSSSGQPSPLAATRRFGWLPVQNFILDNSVVSDDGKTQVPTLGIFTAAFARMD
jgi:hypothetical protein